MTARSRSGIQLANSWLQTIVLLCGLVALAMKVGSRDHQLEINTTAIGELRSIASDLVKAQVGGEINDANQDRLLDGLVRRIDRMEERVGGRGS